MAAVVTAGCLTLVGCSSGTSSSSSGSSSKKEFKIDLIADLTGTDAGTDGTAAAGVQAAVHAINAAGGVNGAQIKLTTHDAASTPSQGLIAARQAVADKPNVIAVGALSSEVVASEQVFQQANIPVITEASPGELLLPKPKTWYFGVYPVSSQFAQTFVAGAKNALGTLKGKKIAFNGFDTPDVNGVFTTTTALLEKQGATVVDQEKSSGALTTFTSQAQKIVNEKADAVISLDLLPNVVLVAKALQAAGFTGPYLGDTGASEDSTFKTLAGIDYQGQRIFNAVEPGSAPATAAKAVGVDDTGVFFGSGWSIAYLAAEAGKTCGKSCDGPGMIKALESIKSYTPPGGLAVGPLKFSAGRHYAITKIQYFKWDASTSKVVKLGTPIDVG